jgi:putative GTP pyrophosphokinase
MSPSRNQVRKAASTCRKWWLDPDVDAPLTEEVSDAIGLLLGFRATFQKPLDKVTIQLRRFVGYESSDVIVAQRLKRMPTILDKLGRQPTMDITRMQDIGGCRAVLPSAAAVDAVLGRIGEHWHVERVYDYVTTPKPSGYRAIHASVVRDERLIEIQLRTPAQQQWAEAVERAGARLRRPVKDGLGPEAVLRYFQLLAEAISLDEIGQTVDDALVAELDSLSEQVRGLLTRTG